MLNKKRSIITHTNLMVTLVLSGNESEVREVMCEMVRSTDIRVPVKI